MTTRVTFKQCNISGEKISLFIQALHFNYNAADFHWGGEMYRIQRERKEHLLDLVGDKEVIIKRMS